MNADGSGRSSLVEHRQTGDNPDWSPDGKKIAFEAGNGYSDIFVMNADGTGQTNLTNNPAANDADDPYWSPDGKRIVFASGVDDYEIIRQ